VYLYIFIKCLVRLWLFFTSMKQRRTAALLYNASFVDGSRYIVAFSNVKKQKRKKVTYG